MAGYPRPEPACHYSYVTSYLAEVESRIPRLSLVTWRATNRVPSCQLLPPSRETSPRHTKESRKTAVVGGFEWSNATPIKALLTIGLQVPAQHLAPEGLRFSGESAALDVRETDAPSTEALLEHSVLFLEIRNHIQRMAVDPTGKHQED
jgi:hypothetical protein